MAGTADTLVRGDPLNKAFDIGALSMSTCETELTLEHVHVYLAARIGCLTWPEVTFRKLIFRRSMEPSSLIEFAARADVDID